MLHSVSVGPGAIALTRILRGASSIPFVRVSMALRGCIKQGSWDRMRACDGAQIDDDDATADQNLFQIGAEEPDANPMLPALGNP
jgi:hypothetical protein